LQKVYIAYMIMYHKDLTSNFEQGCTFYYGQAVFEYVANYYILYVHITVQF